MPDARYLIPDPREHPDPATAPEPARALYALVEASLAADTRQHSDAHDRELAGALASLLAVTDGTLAAVFAGAPSVAVARHLWRLLDAVWREPAASGGEELGVTVFAVPVVIVAAAANADREDELPGVLAAPSRLAEILTEHRALRGNRTLQFSGALVAADAIDLRRLPELAASRRLSDSRAGGATWPLHALAPAPVRLGVVAGRESVHLRFAVGTAIAKPGVDLVADATVGAWGVPLARELARQLAVGGVPVLALPRAPQPPLPALRQGRIAQREVAAQLFASDALRRFRSTVGEPVAVIAAHRASDAPGGGELRLSLSSPFSPLAPRLPEGFRCPLDPLDRVSDVVTMLVDLLHDCRVADIRVCGGIHAERDAATGRPLLLTPETIPGSTPGTVH